MAKGEKTNKPVQKGGYSMAKFEKATGYVVLVDFMDFKENKLYKVGDDFPVNTSVTRLKELIADDNDGRTDGLKGTPIIEAIN